MVALLLILHDCGVAAKNTLFKHFLRSDRPQLSSACTKNQLSNVPSEIFNLKRNRPRNLHKQICNFREQVVRAGCKLLRANCQSKYQHCGGSLQSCAEKNIRFDCKGHKADLKVEEGSQPSFHKPRQVPYALRPEVELTRLEEGGIQSKVEYSEWATPIVPVVKPNGSVRVCGNFKVSVNPVLFLQNSILFRA